MAKDNKLEHLARVRLFSALTKKELGMVSKASDEVEVPAGTDMVTEGSSGHEFYLILSGEAVVRRNGRKVATLGPGQYFGELSLLDGGPRSATVSAATDMSVLVIGQREFTAVLDEVPGLSHRMLVSMAARLREADARTPTH